MTEENAENKPSEVSEPTPDLQQEPQTEPTEMAGPEPMDEEIKSQPVEEPKKPPLPVFSLKLKAKVLEAIFTAIAIIIDEATFTLSERGLNLKAMDPGHIVMVVFNYPKEAFEEFSVDREGLITFSVKEALKVLRRTGKDDLAELVMVNDSAKVFLKVHSKFAERLFNIPTLESSEEELPEPKLSPEAKMKLSTEAFRNAVEDATLVSDHVKLVAQPEIFELKAQGDTTTADIKFVKGLSPDLLELEKLDIAKPTSAVYSLEWLKELVKGIQAVADIVVVKYSSDMPIQIEAQNVQGSITYYAAPRIEVE